MIVLPKQNFVCKYIQYVVLMLIFIFQISSGFCVSRNNANLKNKVITDAQVGPVYTFRHIPLSMFFAKRTIIVNVNNVGTEALVNLIVTLNITGAANFSDVKTVSSLAPGSSTFVEFAEFATYTMGINTIVVTLPDDDDNSNNQLTYIQNVNPGLVSYAEEEPPSGSYGYNSDMGGFMYSYFSTGISIYINAIRIHISDDVNSIGKTVRAILGSPFGTMQILWQSAPLTITADHLGKYFQFNIDPPYFNIQSAGIRAGLLQPIASQAYFPISYQDEIPRRPGGDFSNVFRYLGGTNFGGMPFTLPSRFMIQLLMNNYVLPVNLVEFKAVNKDLVNELNWVSIQEINFDKFIIERSMNGYDYTIIGEQEGKGTSASQQRYNFIDSRPGDGVNYYKLKMQDLDGNCKYSEVKKVIVKSGIRFTISPNPASDMLHVKYYSNHTGNVKFTITDLSGRKILSSTKYLQRSADKIDIPIADLSKGIYILQLNDDASIIAQGKFIKM